MTWSRGPAEAESPGTAGVGGEDPAQCRPVGLRGFEGEALALLGQEDSEPSEGDPGLDGDRHVGRRIVDDPVERSEVDRHAGPGREAPVSRARCVPPCG